MWVLDYAKSVTCQMEGFDRSDGWSERSTNLDSRLDDEEVVVSQGANARQRGNFHCHATSAAIGIVEQPAVGGIEDQIIVRVLGASRLIDA